MMPDGNIPARSRSMLPHSNPVVQEFVKQSTRHHDLWNILRELSQHLTHKILYGRCCRPN